MTERATRNVQYHAALVCMSLSPLNPDVAIMTCIEAATRIMREHTGCTSLEAAKMLAAIIETIMKAEQENG